MADRRMFSKTIISSGKFLRMPPTTRLLYYDLGMAADDDGVVEAYPILVMTKATEDDLRVLVAKGFVKILNDDLVALICDWNTNNIIRSDRYHPSIYKDLLLQVGNQLTTNCQPTDNQMETEVRLGKDSIDKEKTLSKDSAKEKGFVRPSVDEVKAYCEERGNSVDAEMFVDFYESKGWMVGKNKMKNWKAAVRNWERSVKPSKEIDWSTI